MGEQQGHALVHAGEEEQEEQEEETDAGAQRNPAATNNGRGTAPATGKQNGVPNANRNGASSSGSSRNQSAARQGDYNNGGGSGAPMKKDQQQQPAGVAVEDAEARGPEQEPQPEEADPVIPTFGLWFEKSAAKKAGASGAKASNAPAAAAAAAEVPRDATTSGT